MIIPDDQNKAGRNPVVAPCGGRCAVTTEVEGSVTLGG